MTPFSYEDYDPAGKEILEALGHAEKFNRWMYDEIRPWMSGKILEIGSGIGNISRFFIDDNKDITLSDLRERYCRELRKRFPQLSADKVQQMDLVDPDFANKFSGLTNTFDSVFALNVIEHIREDGIALMNLRSLLKDGGTFLMLVPAHQWLYNPIDENLQHFRRYSVKTASKLFQKNGFTVDRTWYFNSLGIAAWWWGGFRKQKLIRNSQMDFYDRLVPGIRFLDKVFGKEIGLSVIVAGRKK
jgi:SAM-dependent methyltransferase